MSAPALRVHRIRFSTNVERIALALGLKSVETEWVDHAREDRSAIRALSGQELVPVLEAGGRVIADSPAILAWIEATFPDPPLLPSDPARREEIAVFCDWFNRVWKLAPNRLTDESDPPRGLQAELARSAERFERLLTGRPFLFGDAPTLADVTAFPFLRLPAEGIPPGDDDPFHAALVAGLAPGALTRAWVARVAALPQA